MQPRSPSRVSIPIACVTAALLAVAAAAPEGKGEPPRSDLRPAGEVAAAGRSALLAGMTLAPVPALLRTHVVLPERAGLVVREVLPGSPAEAAGLRVHDILVSLDGQVLLRPDHPAELVAAASPDAALVLDIRRAGKPLSVSLNHSRSSGPSPEAPQPGAPAALAEPPPEAAPIPGGHPAPAPTAAVPSAPFVPPAGARRLGTDAVLLEDRDYWLKVYRDSDICLMARDARGWLVFNGPIATPQQRSLIPKRVRERVAQLELMLDTVAAPATTSPPPAAAAPPPSVAKPATPSPVSSAATERPPATATPAVEPVTEIGRLDVDPIEIR